MYELMIPRVRGTPAVPRRLWSRQTQESIGAYLVNSCDEDNTVDGDGLRVR